MSKYDAHPYVSNLSFDLGNVVISEHLREFVGRVRKAREFRDAKIGILEKEYGTITNVFVCFDGDIAASGALIYDTYADKFGVASKLINTERGTGFGAWRYNSRWTGNLSTAVSHARKYVAPLTEDELISRTLKDAPRDIIEVSNKGSTEKSAALWSLRYMTDKRQEMFIQMIPQILPMIDDMGMRMEMENIHAKWAEGEAMSQQVRKVEPWVAVVNTQRGVVHIHRKGDLHENNVPRVTTLPLSEIPVDIAGKLQVLSMLKAGDTVEGVGCKLSEDRYSFIMPKSEE
jgi:hypothetical protein